MLYFREENSTFSQFIIINYIQIKKSLLANEFLKIANYKPNEPSYPHHKRIKQASHIDYEPGHVAARNWTIARMPQTISDTRSLFLGLNPNKTHQIAVNLSGYLDWMLAIHYH